MKIKNLKIYNFRQFGKKELNFTEDVSVIVGPNAKGKSTIIEAIHVLSTGQSPWTSDNSAIVRKSANQEQVNNTSENSSQQPAQNWPTSSRDGRVEADIQIDSKVKNLAVVLKANNGSAVKQFKINEKPVTKNKFLQNLITIIFSPDLIDVLMFEPKQRRSFLDSYISKIDIEYEEITQKYNKAVRQRNTLLKFLSKKNNISSSDKINMKFWTDSIIDLGTTITIKRIDFVDKLNQVNPKLYPNKIKYKPNFEINDIETLADPNYLKKAYREMLSSKFKKELALGVTLVGPHRDDWILTCKGRNLNKYGSRGEKRMAIADIAFKMNQLLMEAYKEKPVVLLDDVSSELDKKNIERLLREKILPDQQTIITTTDIKNISRFINKGYQKIQL